MSSPAPHAPRVPHVPYTGGEKESLHISLDRHRDVVLWKLEGLDDEQVRRPMIPTGTNLLGLVKHLATVEYDWFCAAFGRPTEAFWFDTATEDMTVGPDETTADILAFYFRRQAAPPVTAGTGAASPRRRPRRRRRRAGPAPRWPP
ncbi:DUF664 domain-containing protein [Streptomyces rubiginosohelvolus]|uniref:mycothiol transferase n=1 Tax=Streptomyces rubiginosohelvolus TaxID=67362 RepID=UPI0033AA4EC6